MILNFITDTRVLMLEEAFFLFMNLVPLSGVSIDRFLPGTFHDLMIPSRILMEYGL